MTNPLTNRIDSNHQAHVQPPGVVARPVALDRRIRSENHEWVFDLLPNAADVFVVAEVVGNAPEICKDRERAARQHDERKQQEHVGRARADGREPARPASPIDLGPNPNNNPEADRKERREDKLLEVVDLRTGTVAAHDAALARQSDALSCET